ncbi:MAG: NfeD family protein [Faecousia sp.]
MDIVFLIWVGLMVVFLIVEAACPIHLVSVWFAVGAVGAAVACWLNAALWIQIAIFVVISAGLLILLWPLTKKYLNPGHTATNVDSIPGSEAYVTASIDNVHAQGQVKLNGMEWTARSTSGAPIPEGTLVKVDKVEGVKVFVSPVKEAVTV